MQEGESMNRKIVVYSIAMALIAVFSSSLKAADAGADGREEYGQFRKGLLELYNAGKYEESAKLIEENYDRFPGQAWKMSYNMAAVCAHLEDYARGIDYLTLAHRKGQWFGVWAFEGDFWTGYRELDDFNEFLTKNIEMMEEAQKNAKPKLEVVLPESAEEGKKYPLFIALHGGGENIEAFKPHWKSGVMEGEFIIAYIQSSQVASMEGFMWENQEIAKKELGEAYVKICADYPVDTTEVLIGGFSSGGYASLVATFFEAVPVKGFIILCPPMPDNITSAEVTRARERGVRGTIITTELDRRVPDQRRMADLFRDSGLQYQFIITPDVGHWYPDNLPELIDMAIAHIRSG
jgi:predicted esterase